MSFLLLVAKETLTLRSKTTCEARIGRKLGSTMKIPDSSISDTESIALFNSISNISRWIGFSRRRQRIALLTRRLIQSQLTNQRFRRSLSKWPSKEERSFSKTPMRSTSSTFFFIQTMFKVTWIDCKESMRKSWQKNTVSWPSNQRPTLAEQPKVLHGLTEILLFTRDPRYTRRGIVPARRSNLKRMHTS